MRTIILALLLTGCATTASVAPAWLTLRLIERGTVTAEQVITTTERMQQMLALDAVTLLELGAEIRSVIGYADMPASDRLLVDALLTDIANHAGHALELPVTPDAVERIRRVLVDIQRYAER